MRPVNFFRNNGEIKTAKTVSSTNVLKVLVVFMLLLGILFDYYKLNKVNRELSERLNNAINVEESLALSKLELEDLQNELDNADKIIDSLMYMESNREISQEINRILLSTDNLFNDNNVLSSIRKNSDTVQIEVKSVDSTEINEIVKELNRESKSIEYSISNVNNLGTYSSFTIVGSSEVD